MKNQSILYGIIGLLIGVLVTVFIASNAVNNNMTGMMGMMGMRTGTVQNRTMNSYMMDAHFIEQMIPHHEDAITLAKLAQAKAKRPEVQQLAQNIIDSQSKEITQMKNWYKDWFGRDLPTGQEVMNTHGMMSNTSGMHMGVRGDTSDLQTLEQAADFDKAFVEHMIPHHQMAVMMASMLKDGTIRPEMKKLADDIVTAQTKEIEQMREWLRSW